VIEGGLWTQLQNTGEGLPSKKGSGRGCWKKKGFTVSTASESREALFAETGKSGAKGGSSKN